MATDPHQALEALLNTGVSSTRKFPANSRYCNTGIAIQDLADGGTAPYLRRRFIPPADSIEAARTHLVIEGERLDHLAARYLGDPLLYWRICDANGVSDPAELEHPGRIIRIPAPGEV